MINERKVKVQKKINDYKGLVNHLLEIIKIYKEKDYLNNLFLSLSTEIITHNNYALERNNKFVNGEISLEEFKTQRRCEEEIQLCMEKQKTIIIKVEELHQYHIKIAEIVLNLDSDLKNNDVDNFLKEFIYNASDDKKIVGNYTRKEFSSLTRLLFDSKLPKVCELCGSTENLHIHHSIYKIPIERKHLQRLCQPCHNKTHKTLKRLGKYVE